MVVQGHTAAPGADRQETAGARDAPDRDCAAALEAARRRIAPEPPSRSRTGTRAPDSVSRWQHEYRGWRIRQERTAFRACGPACTLTATSLIRLWAGVDAIERSCAGQSAPVWHLFALVFPELGPVDLDRVDDPDLDAACRMSGPVPD